jgi:hypothetical protein
MCDLPTILCISNLPKTCYHVSSLPKTCCVLPCFQKLLPLDPFIIVIPYSKHLLWSSKNLEIGSCIHGNKLRLFMFSWLLPSYLSFLFFFLLLHSCKKFMLSYNNWLLHSYCNTFPTQHLSFCLCSSFFLF